MQPKIPAQFMRHVLLVLSLIALALPQGVLRSQTTRDIATISRDASFGELFRTERRPSFNKPIPASATFFSINPAVFDQVSLANHPTILVDRVQLNNRQQGTLALKRFDVLSPGARVVAGTAKGDLVVDLPRALFYTGSVKEIPGSFVYLALFRDYCTGYIEIPSGNEGIRRYTIAPLSIQDGQSATMAIYDEFDALMRNGMLGGAGHWGCGAEDLPEYQPAVDQVFKEAKRSSKSSRRVQGNDMLVAQIALEGDSAFYAAHNRNLSRAMHYALTVMGAASAIYQRDVNVALQVPYLRVWTGGDPYPGSTSSILLSQFRNYWNANMNGVSRTVAQLMSTSSIGGGIAYVNVLCSSSTGYAVLGMNNNVTYPSTAYVWDTDVTAHETGHNFGSPHTHSCLWEPAIDSCYTAEGTCFSSTRPRVGTIMSYCHLTQFGTQLYMHPRVADLVRSKAEMASCISLLENSAANDVAVSTINVPTPGGRLATSSAFTPSATFKNIGTSSQSALSVTCTIRDSSGNQVYTNSQTIASLAAGAYTTVNFLQTSIDSIARYSATVSITLASDAFPANNSQVRPFEVVASTSGTLTLLGPNTATAFRAGAVTPITWSFSGSISSLRIDFSADDGASWSTVATNVTPASGTLNWTVPAIATSGGRIRISDRENSATADISDAAFSIVTLPLGWQWARAAGGPREDAARALALDTRGNLLVAGTFNDSIRFGSTTLTATGATDAFLAKFSPGGSLLWARQIAGSGNDSALAVAVDANNNVLVAGGFFSTVSFGSTSLTSAGDQDLFVARYDADGTLLWAQKGGGTGRDQARGVDADASGNAVVAGLFSNTATFGSTSLSSSGSTDIFAAKYAAASGAVQWAQKGGGSEADEANAIAVDGSGNVYVAGKFKGSATIATTALASAGGEDGFVGKYNSSGAGQWSASYGGSDGDDGRGVRTDGSGNVYVAGTITGTVQYGTVYATSAGGRDMALAKYNSSGTVQWVRTAGSTDDDYAGGLASDGSNNLYLAGHFQGTLRTGNLSTTSAGGSDVMIAKFAADGTVAWLRNGGGARAEEAYGIAVNSNGDHGFVGGAFSYLSSSQPSIFGTDTLRGAGGNDAMMMRIGMFKVTSPREGDSWSPGTSQNITWSISGPSAVKIEYSTNSGSTWSTIIASTANDGSHAWTLPSTPATQVMVRVSDADSPSLYGQATSGTFAIGGLAAPTGVAALSYNAAVHVTWTGSTSDGITGYGIYRGSTADNMSRIGTVATAIRIYRDSSVTNCTDYVYGVKALAGSAESPMSNTAAARPSAPGTITVTAPTANERIAANSSRAIAWSWTGCFAETKIEYSTNSGSSWVSITDQTANNGSYSWQVPNISSTRALLRVSDRQNSAVLDVSDTFSICNMPAITVSGALSFCEGGSTLLGAPAGFTSYLWSNGATTREITVTSAGSYSVTVTDAGGCSGTSAAVNVVRNTRPAPAVTAGGPTTFCQGGNVTLTAPAGFVNYLWSNGATTRAITVTSAGSYSVTTTDANGCSGSSAATSVTVNANPAPTVAAGGPTTFCQGESVTLSAPTGYTSYRWSNGATTREITVTAAGSYTVTVTNSSGCSGTSAATAVTVNTTPTPTISANGPTTFCQGGNVTLSAPTGFSSYRWSNGATTREITVTATGSFTVTVTGSNGCSGVSAATAVTVNATPAPAITPNGPTSFCEGGSVVLAAPAGFASYRWSNGATSHEITVTATGNFTVTVADANGCSGTSAATAVTVNTMLTPTISASGPTTFCQGESVTLSAPAGYASYLWSNGATAREITVSATGSFTVTVNDGNGCSGTSAATAVTVNARPTPAITPNGPTTFCQGGNVILSAPTGYASYRWSNGATTREITVTATGSFTVTATDANGCSGTSTATAVTVNATPAPAISANGPTTFCEGGSVVLAAPAGFASYRWSNGATTREITVTATGNFTVTVTDANGCSGVSAATAVTVNTMLTPTISASGPTTFCQGENVTLSAPAGYTTYRWSNGATTREITVSTAGNFTVTVSDANGCSGVSAATAVTVNAKPAPTISANGPTTFCEGGSVVLSAPTGYSSYRWSNGATTREITVTATGNFTVTVTDANGCSGTSAATAVTVNTMLTPTITADGPTTFCQGEDVTLSAPAGYSSYRWSNGATTREITVTATGSFTVTVNDGNGCSGTSAATAVTVNARPTPATTPNGPTTFCQGGNVILSAPTGFSSYRWSNGATTREITVTATGSFTVTVTDANGCAGVSAATAVTVNATPTPTISANGPTTFCEGGSVVLSAPTGFSSYRWSNGATTREITITATGNFTVTVADANGCSGTSAATAVTVNATPTPTISANGPTTFCQGENVTLSAPTGYTSYRWSNGATTREITVSTTGNFTVTVADANGCSGTSAATAVTVNTRPAPAISASGPTSICQGESVTLSAPAGYASYRWSNGATSREIIVTATGNFTVTVADANGCSGTSAATAVTVHTMPNPTITADGPLTFCLGEQVTLSAPAGYASYRWSNGATTREITVSASGTFTVTATNSESCTGTSPEVVVTVRTRPTPIISANGPTTFCLGENVTLSAPAGFASYRWSNGATTREITVTQSASLIVTVTDANGCTGVSIPTVVVAHAVPAPAITADGPTSFCEGGTVVLAAPAGFTSYRWSNGATTREITVSTAGNFTVTVTDANGCSGTSAATLVTINPKPTPAISANGPTTFCQGGNVTLSAPTGFSSYRWSNGATTREITVTATGSFTVTATDANGCSGTSSATAVTVNATPAPAISANGPTTFCEGGSVVLAAPAGFASYRWSNGATTREITVTATGNFTVTVTDANGCSGVSAATAVTVNTMLTPTIAASGPTTFCQGENVTLSAPAGYTSYRWSNGATTREITVSASGSFTVSVSDANGCEGISTATAVTVNARPAPAITAGGPTTFCQGESVTLSAPAGFAGYRWSNGATTREITVSTAGSFTVTVTDANGCSGVSAATAVTVNAKPTPAISANGPTTFCQGESVTLSAPAGFSTYRWSNGATTREITVTATGSFTVTVTDANGCSGTSAATAVTVNAKPAPAISANGPTTFCQGEDVTLSAPAGFASYRWSNGATTREITVTATGTFTVTVSDANGCSGTSAATAVTVNAKPAPVISAGGPTTFCEGGNVTLSAPAGFTGYRWSNGATSREITVAQSGTFTVTVTNASNCSGTSPEVVVTMHTRPTPAISAGGPTTFCEGDEVTLSAPAGFASYRWSNGATTRQITVAQSSSLTVTVTDDNGCSGTSAPMVVVANRKPSPAITADGPTAFCEGGQVTLSAPAGFASYRWSNGATTREITVAQSGTFTVTVVDANGCSGIAPEMVVTMHPKPAPAITADGPTTFCQGEDVTLSAPAGYNSYRWSNGATSREITVSTNGSFTVTVTNANGCSGVSAPTLVTVHSTPRPAITAAGPTSFCEGESVTLSAPAGYRAYRWSNGATSREITVTATGSFTVTVTDANGCNGTSEAIAVTMYVRPQPSITAGGPTTFCEGGSVVLSAPAGHSTYRWSNGATSQQITVAQSGNYSVTVADDNGCNGTSTAITVTVNPKPQPVISANGPTTFCQGESVTLSAPAGFTSYNWSTGETSREITVDRSGHYFVTVGNASGCSNSSSTVVVVVHARPQPVISAGGPTSFCEGGNVTLTAAAGFASYRWSNGATTREITVDRSGEYTVTVSDANGCSGVSANMVVRVFDKPQPAITAGGPTTFCEGGNVTLAAPAGFTSYRWSNGASGREIRVQEAGSYAVTVTDGNGCTGVSAPVTVKVNQRPRPTITTGGPTSFCQGESVTLTAPAGFAGYRWSDGQSTRQITATQSGEYTVTVTDANGCEGTSPAVTVRTNATPRPTISADGPTTICKDGNVTLTASAGFAGYRWSNGATTRQITISAAGNYTVTVTDSNGCSGTSAATQVTVNPLPKPSITLAGPASICDGEQARLQAPAGFASYRWSNGATTREITVGESGSYTVTVTDFNGCSGSSEAVRITVNAKPVPSITANGPATLCNGGRVTLSAPIGFADYRWSNGATSRQIEVTEAGDYTVTVTNVHGCSGTSEVFTLRISPAPMPTISASDLTNFCEGGKVTLSATAGYRSYRWSNGATSREITVSKSGTFSVIVTDSNGCSGTSPQMTVTVTAKPQPIITASGPTSICSGGSVTLSAPAGFATYLWSNGATSREIVVNRSGLYSVKVATASGCSGTSNVMPVLVTDKLLPIIGTDGPLTFHKGGRITLSAPAGYDSYQWSSGERTRQITVSKSGTFSVTVSNSNGCTGTSEPVAIQVVPRSQPYIIVEGPTKLCPHQTVTLAAPAGYRSYYWSNGENTRTIVVDREGQYSVMTVDEEGMEGTSDTMAIGSSSAPVKPEIIRLENGSLLSCSIEASAYRWYRNNEPLEDGTERTYRVTVNGNYSVQAFNDGGCDAKSDPERVTIGTISGITGIRSENGSAVAVTPNPATESFTVELRAKVSGEIHLALTDMSGRAVLQFTDSYEGTGYRRTMDVTTLSSGIYLLEIRSGNDVWKQKVMVKQ